MSPDYVDLLAELGKVLDIHALLLFDRVTHLG
jgi:hypothetical protein